MHAQLSLLGGDTPAFDATFRNVAHERLDRHSWLDLCPGWLDGDHRLLEHLAQTTCWQHEQRQMYDREVAVPRLTATFPQHGPGHPLLAQMAAALSARYGRAMHAISAAWYRDGRDSVAPHADRVGRAVDDCVVAILSLGEPRRFLMKPLAGGHSRVWRPGHGDLVVMGGRCQRDWVHGVPKAARAGPRISVQFRPAGRYAVTTSTAASEDRHRELR